jgi:choline dehydrogenase
MRFLLSLCYFTIQLGVVLALPEKRQNGAVYDYIVIGSGPGGGPLACRLARAGFHTLLIEAGDDQGTNYNVTVPGYLGLVSQDPKLRWDFYVNHFPDQTTAQRDPKYVYDVNGYPFTRILNGTAPPQGAKPKGILYPRAGTLGGCNSHNALIWIEPHASDWSNIVSLTGDSSWNSTAMRNTYLSRVYEWQTTQATDPTIVTHDITLSKHLLGGAAEMGVGPSPLNAIPGLTTLLLTSPNGGQPGRDSQEGFYQVPLIMNGGARHAVRDHIVDTVNAGYPLTVQTNTFVTKINFDTTSSPPLATGVSYLQGSHLYSASPLKTGAAGTPGSAIASREVIISGGTFNTVELLKLSGIGPAAELKKFHIPILVNSPGVGANLQDRYEIGVTTIHPDDFNVLNGCTFDMKDHDQCFKTWQSAGTDVLALRGAYASNGLAATMGKVSSTSPTGDIDLFIFGAPVNFRGFFPQWGDYTLQDHKHFTWYSLKAHTLNRAGTITLRSSNPLDPPIINFNTFDSGDTDQGQNVTDITPLVEAIKLARGALQHFHDYDLLPSSSFAEVYPGPSVQSDADLEQYIKDNSFGHHACCTAAIGADGDPNAVLDSKFRVRGVQGLRVVDASVFPRIPGIFIQSAVYMISEKAADTILYG